MEITCADCGCLVGEAAGGGVPALCVVSVVGSVAEDDEKTILTW